MALKVWLPLNGDLENKGISDDISFPLTSGNFFTLDGKTGDGLKLTKLQQILNTSSCMTGAKEVSYAFWVKVNTAWSANWLDGIRWISTDGSSTSTERQEFYTNCTYIGTWYKGGAISGKSFTPGVWTHLAATINYSTGQSCFYINGILQGSASNVDTTYYCRGDFYIGDNGVDILENDVRIYDHCLSQKEVKEISQGLILHYKLDGFSGGVGENLVLNSKTFSGWSVGSGWIKGEEDGYTTYNFSRTGATANNWVRLIPTLRIDPNDYPDGITVSMDIKPVDISVINNTCLIALQIYNAAGTRIGWKEPQRGTSGMINNTWTRISYTFSQNDLKTISVSGYTAADISYTQFSFQLVQNGNITIRKIKIEKGSITTPWMLASEDLGIDTTKITDSSGYGNDGFLVNGTNEVMGINNGRYQVCTSLLGTTVDNSSNTIVGAQYLYAPFKMPAWNAITVAWWGNNIAYGRGGIFETTGTTGNIWEGNDYSTTAIANWDSTFGIYNGSTRINIFNNFVKDSIWHYHTITFDGTNVKYYCDSILKQTSALTGTLPAITGFKMGLGRAGGVYRQIKQKLNDLRIYATALSAEDIADLYHIPANIDNLGRIHGFEFEEIYINNQISDWTNISLISMNGWSGSKTYDTVNDCLNLTATNGWRTFAWSSGELEGSAAVFEFDYCLIDNTNLSTSGIFIINRDAVEYGVSLMQLDTTLNKWNHCRFETETALKYLGFNIRGVDNTGKNVTLQVKNVIIRPANNNNNSILRNGIIKTEQITQNNYTNASLFKDSIIANNFIEK